MKQEILNQIFTLLIGGVLGVFFKYSFDYRAMVYKELWGRRYEEYKKMFSLTGLLPQYPKQAKVTYEELFKQSVEMSDWFFKDGGLLLSTKTKNKYDKVQKNIQAIFEETKDDDKKKLLKNMRRCGNY